MTYKTTDGSPLKFYVVYKLDDTINYYILEYSEAKMLDQVMCLPDGDLANYEIYLQIM